MKTIEIGVNYVDRDADPPTSSTAGVVVFDRENPSAPPQVLNPLDFQTIALLKRYIDGLWAENQRLVSEIEGT